MSYLEQIEAVTARDTLLNEIVSIEDFCHSFDLRAFPLPMRIGMERHDIFCMCGAGAQKSVHVFMRIQPRGPEELPTIPREYDGKFELRTCAYVHEASWRKDPKLVSVEKVRVAIKNMVLHEVYEALHFRGRRIMDPHNTQLKPADQPF